MFLVQLEAISLDATTTELIGNINYTLRRKMNGILTIRCNFLTLYAQLVIVCL